jgi:hypothetical protein
MQGISGQASQKEFCLLELVGSLAGQLVIVEVGI